MPDQEVASVALGPCGQQLYVLAPASGLLSVLDPDLGANVGGLQPDAGAWAIEAIGRL